MAKKRLLPLAIALVKVCSIFLVPSLLSARTILNIGITPYPPYADSNKKDCGLNARIITAAFAAVDRSVEVHFTFEPFDLIIDKVNKGKMQAGVYGIKQSDPKTTIADGHFIAGPCVFVYSKRNQGREISFEKLQDLKGYRIESKKGAHWNKILQEASLNVREDSDDITAFKKLAAVPKDTDLWATIDLFAIETIKKEDLNRYQDFKITRPFFINGLSLVFSKSANNEAEKLRKTFVAGMFRIVENGTYTKIASEYYSGEKPPQLYHDDFKRSI